MVAEYIDLDSYSGVNLVLHLSQYYVKRDFHIMESLFFVSILLEVYFSNFQLFFQSKLLGVHMMGKLPELHLPSEYNHSCGISIQVEIHL